MLILFAQLIAAWILADDASHRVGQLQLDAGRHDCDGAVQEIPAYRFLVAVTITEVCLWQGSDAAPPGEPFPAVDLFAVLYASRPYRFKLIEAPEDRYAAPNTNGKRCRTLEHELQAGDTIGGGFFCSALFGRTSHTHVGVSVDYVKR